nr:MAG: galactose-1-epimerase [Chloroflexota bacterium]
MALQHQVWGTTADGAAVDLFTLTSGAGLEARVMTYGATLVSLRAPDRAGNVSEVTLGFDTLDAYLAGHPFFGSVVGRYGNRIAGGRFQLGGATFQLARNNGPNHLHGGERGFDKVLWRARELSGGDEPAVELTYLSPDGEEGYPGNLSVAVTYTLTAQGELRIDYRATTDRETVVNLTNHAYFNLAGGGPIYEHELELAAEHFLPTDATQIPTGERRPVRGTVMDFTTPTPIGARIHADDEQLRFANGGYDHTWVLSEESGTYRLAARVYEPRSGRVMEVFTTQPGVQFYTGNFLDGSLRGRGGQVYAKHTGFCLETQHFPDSPNHPDFPSTVLAPGEEYRHTTAFRFGAR